MEGLSRLLPRLVVLFALLAITGVPAYAAEVLEVDGCADACDDEQGAAGCPEDADQDGCPPLCHTCVCGPVFVAPTALVALAVSDPPRSVAVSLAHRAPRSPHREGVFHPPRLST